MSVKYKSDLLCFNNIYKLGISYITCREKTLIINIQIDYSKFTIF